MTEQPNTSTMIGHGMLVKNAFKTVGKILCLLFILFQNLVPLYHTPSNVFKAKKMELLWQGACNKNTYSDSWNRSRFYICRPSTDRIFPRRKQRKQELRDWALLAEWLDGKREENDDVIIMHNGKMTNKRKAYGTKWDTNTIPQADTTQSLTSKYFYKGLCIYISEYHLTLTT